MRRRSLLFLCTGNYYRSRFAEELFNHLAVERGLQWAADSRGLARDFAIFGNPGPISAHTRSALEARGIVPRNGERLPRTMKAADFERYDRIIALSRDEHLPMMREFFPDRADLIDYWVVEDLHLWDADRAISAIAEAVAGLAETLASAEGTSTR